MVEVPATRDLPQIYGDLNLERPEIRVWCRAKRIDRHSDDYYMVFPSFHEAENFINGCPEADRYPLVAFRGYELHVYQIEPAQPMADDGA